ncbi:MAG: hypothetical protein H7258_03190 [Ferruginibacter sp.]|nr:hypothetical protein [Ferruginibacter sp.]
MDANTRVGTCSGTLLVLLFKINNEELLTTVILAGLGAVVSFGTSVLLKCLMKKITRK